MKKTSQNILLKPNKYSRLAAIDRVEEARYCIICGGIPKISTYSDGPFTTAIVECSHCHNGVSRRSQSSEAEAMYSALDAWEDLNI